jgi:hypothetical protein
MCSNLTRMEPQPVSYAPAGDPSNALGWSGDLPGIRRVLATVEFTDGHRETFHTHAFQWTATHVQVGVLGQWGSSLQTGVVRVWIPADRVERPQRPPMPGEYAPRPSSGPTAVVLVSSERCPNGHSLQNGSFSAHPCGCPRAGRAHGGNGYYSWGCPTCGATTYGPPPHTAPEPAGLVPSPY